MDQPLTQSEKRRKKRRRRLRRVLITGLATLLPTVLTGYIIFLLVRFVHNSVGRWIALVLAKMLGQVDPVTGYITNAYTVVAGDILAVVIVFVLAYVLGAFTASFVGGRVVRAGEALLGKVPLVKVIYPYVKQVTDFVFSDKRRRFRRVVAVPYPRQGMYSIGFVTGNSMRTINDALEREDLVHVFIPSSPTPVTGYVVFLPREDVIELPITVDEALRFAISGGVIVPFREVVTAPEEALLEAPEEEEEDEE
jgi:uncharacterized membrane protein